MLHDKPPGDDFWCPLADAPAQRRKRIELSLEPPEWSALSRLAAGDWVADALIARLEALGLAERAFGQALLTRLGRAALGQPE
jgi:hypothetical protein